VTTSRADFLRHVAAVADRTNLPECAVIAAMVDRVTQHASQATDPAQTAYLDQVAAAMSREIGPALDRDAGRGR
jgi:hypothetical protein